jgi:hypothetical protein
MQGVKRFFIVSFLLTLVAGALYFALRAGQSPSVNINSSYSAEAEIDSEINDINSILMQYQLDVYVTGSHMSKHASSSDALRCMNNRGNIATFSEFNSRKLHLLCWDGQTLYDIIINRINYWVEKYSNPKSELVTAYAPEGVEGADQTSKVNFYLEHLKNTVGGKVVNLKFGSGEVMFIPK